jgi:subtilisin family serine protease
MGAHRILQSIRWDPSGSFRCASSSNPRATLGVSTWFILFVALFWAIDQSAYSQSLARPGVKPATPVGHGATATPSNRSVASGHILVAPNNSSSEDDFQGALSGNGGHSIGKLSGLDVHVVNVPPGQEKATAARLTGNPHIRFAEADELVEPAMSVNDPEVASEWHLATISAPIAWDNSTGSAVTIAILDTGVDGTHPDLAPHIVAGWNFYDNNSNTSDVYGHGTAVAGSAAAALNNGVGVAGVAGNANIMPVRISDPTGYALWSTIAQGLTWAADHGARVANISYSVAGSSTVISAANYFRSKGGVVAVSAGNTGALDGTAPTSSMLVVSATDSNDLLASFSTFGSFVSIAAPGVSIYTTANGGGYRYASGTSFSSPIVAGAAALVLSRRPDFSPSQVEAALKSTATDLGTGGVDIYFGAGRLNAAAAVAQAMSSGSSDTVAPTVAIASPTGGTVSGIVTVSVSASDNIGVARVDLRVNGSTVATGASAPFQFAWNSTTVANGTATLTAIAYDAAGNSKTSSPVSVTVSNGTATDTIPPTVAISSPSGSAPNVSGTITVAINASDNVGVTRVDLRVNGATVGSGNAAPYQFAWNSATVPNGAAVLTAVAYDAAGNSAVSAPVTVNVSNGTVADTTPPTLAFTSPSDGATVSGSVTITTSASDSSGVAGITQRLYIDGALKTTVSGKASISYKWNTRSLSAGAHTIVVIASDAAGNSTTRQIQVTTAGK